MLLFGSVLLLPVEFKENATPIISLLSRGLTRAGPPTSTAYEHPRTLRFSRKSNPGPPALQANTLCKEPFKRRYLLLFGNSFGTYEHPRPMRLSRKLNPGPPALQANTLFKEPSIRTALLTTYYSVPMSNEHPRPMRLSRKWNPGPPARERTLYAKSHSNGVINCNSEPRLVLLQLFISMMFRDKPALTINCSCRNLEVL